VAHEFVKPVTLTYKVTPSLFEAGNTSWQTRNIVSTSVDATKVLLTDQEPVVKMEKPKRRFNVLLILIAIVIAIMFALQANSVAVGIIVAVLGVGAVIVAGNVTYKNHYVAWSEQKRRVERASKLWNELTDSPPFFYSLVLDTASGRATVFHTHSNSEVSKLRELVNRAMSDPSAATSEGTVSVLHLGNKTPYNVVSEYYQKKLSEIFSS
jgi:hypothetical protein